VAEALRGNVAASDQKRIVAISSGLASIAQNTSGGRYSYRTSKTALNAAIRSLAMDLRGRGVIAVVLSPGWVRTRMGGAGAPLGAEQSVDDMRRVIAGLTREDTGAFLKHDGTHIPW
jgi:NAD(P)-dependent dehydrogenase (short-subunit alcohol dehydrogenase family)